MCLEVLTGLADLNDASCLQTKALDEAQRKVESYFFGELLQQPCSYLHHALPASQPLLLVMVGRCPL